MYLAHPEPEGTTILHCILDLLPTCSSVSPALILLLSLLPLLLGMSPREQSGIAGRTTFFFAQPHTAEAGSRLHILADLTQGHQILGIAAEQPLMLKGILG